MTRLGDVRWAVHIQKTLAKPLIYSRVWPSCKVKCLDDDPRDELKVLLDKAGADKMIIEENDNLVFIGQRFRTYAASLGKGYDDFTLRKRRPRTNYKAEAYKQRYAHRNGTGLIKYYAYGHLNPRQDGFTKFRILRFQTFLAKWINEELAPEETKNNTDKSSSFYTWSFENIPNDCIHWELDKPVTIHNPPPTPRTEFNLTDYIQTRETQK